SPTSYDATVMIMMIATGSNDQFWVTYDMLSRLVSPQRILALVGTGPRGHAGGGSSSWARALSSSSWDSFHRSSMPLKDGSRDLTLRFNRLSRPGCSNCHHMYTANADRRGHSKT